MLQNGADDFEDSEEVYEAVGEVLQEIASDKSEEDIKFVALLKVMYYNDCFFIFVEISVISSFTC